MTCFVLHEPGFYGSSYRGGSESISSRYTSILICFAVTLSFNVYYSCFVGLYSRNPISKRIKYFQ